ncbi:MAG: hypothetical protein ACLTYW_07400 [Collinsella sp.]
MAVAAASARLGRCDEVAAAGKNASREREVQQPQQQIRRRHEPTRRRRRHLSSEEREDAFRAAAAREAGAAPKGASAPMRLSTRAASHVARRSARRVRAVAIPRARNRSLQCPPWPIRSRMARSGHAPSSRRWRGAAARLRMAPLATSASRARSRWRGLGRPGSKAPSPSSFPQAAPGWWRGLDPVFVRTTTARRRITPASGFSRLAPSASGYHSAESTTLLRSSVGRVVS